MMATSIWTVVYMIAMFTITQAAAWWVENGDEWLHERDLRRTERARVRAIAVAHYRRVAA